MLAAMLNGAGDVRRVVADEHLQPQPGQAARDGAVALVGARHAVAQVVQDLGDGAHARAADAAKEPRVRSEVCHPGFGMRPCQPAQPG